MAFTFTVDDVPLAGRPLPTVPLRRAVEQLIKTPAEACGAATDDLVAVDRNAFLTAAWYAFADHRPLVLTPDAVWLCIAQGLAHHVNHGAEALRKRFVQHEGRKQLLVRRDDFIKGSPANPWPEVFADFSAQIAGHIGRQRDLFVCDFSTTGPVERTASELVLMDAMQQYFEYEVHTLCGIPRITLAGTVDDWKSVRRRTRMLAEYELTWWTSVLLPVLDEFIAAADGRPDVAFWRAFFKDRGGSGGPYLHGWILLFFPYLSERGELVVSPMVADARGASPIRPGGGPADWIRQEINPSSIPLGLARAPLKWQYFEQVFPMDLVGGFVGIAQDAATMALSPAIGWAVRDHADATLVRRSDVRSSRHRAADAIVPPIRARAGGGPRLDDPNLERLFSDETPQWTAREAPDDGVFLATERVPCSRGTTGRLLLAEAGLYFIPGDAPTALGGGALPWLGRAFTDDDDLPPDQTDSFAALRGRSPAEQVAAVPAAIHLPTELLVDAEFTTTDLGTARTLPDGGTVRTYTGAVRALEIAVLLPTGERLCFTLQDPPREPLAAWRAAVGHSG